MDFISVFILGLLLIIGINAVTFFMRPWQKYKVAISFQQIKPAQIIYKQYHGPYLNIKDCFEQLVNTILDIDKKGESGFQYQDQIKQHFGIFYDKEDTLMVQGQARAIYGFIVPESDRQVQDQIIKTFIEKDFQLGNLPASRGLHGEMPNEEYYFYMLRQFEFQPVFKDNKEQIKQGYMKYQQFNKERVGCQLEIYDKDTLHFYLPLENIQKFQLSQCPKGEVQTEEQPMAQAEDFQQREKTN